MGIRFRSYSVYGLGYCPTMSWSAIIIVNSVCDTYTSFATRLRFDLYTFWEIFGWVWLWSLCVQQFWACKFTVSLCLLLLVRRREVRWRETSRMIFEVTLWRSCMWMHRVWLFGDGDGVDVRSWMTAVLSREVLVWLMTKLLRVYSVSPYRRLLRSAILHTKELCRIYLWQCSVIDSSSSVVWLFVLCELEFLSEFMLYAMFST